MPTEDDFAKDPNLCRVCHQWCGLKCERARSWNPRFLAYCAIAHGDADPEIVLIRDGAVAPGGRMAPFIVWSSQQASAWRQETRRYAGPLDHEAFDAWLQRRATDARIARGAA
jgi:hypothetical protein